MQKEKKGRYLSGTAKAVVIGLSCSLSACATVDGWLAGDSSADTTKNPVAEPKPITVYEPEPQKKKAPKAMAARASEPRNSARLDALSKPILAPADDNDSETFPDLTPPRSSSSLRSTALAAPRDAQRPDLPVHAKPGQCYARVKVPARYRTEREKVVVADGYDKTVTEPAEYKWVKEKVLIRPASEVVVEVIPAKYKTVTERVQVEPERWRVKEIPAVYDTVIEKVLVQPARTEWKPGRGPVEKTNHDTGEIMCLVEIPAVYDKVERRVLKKPARSERVRVPAKYDRVSKKVMVSPERVRKETVPAKYKTVKVRKQVRPERTRTVSVPAKTEFRNKKVLISESRVQWQQVLCENNATRSRVREIQDALFERGYDPGKLDGKLGPMTYEAVELYQRDKKLPRGAITYEVLKSLGVQL